jgi:hypothetical protein
VPEDLAALLGAGVSPAIAAAIAAQCPVVVTSAIRVLQPYASRGASPVLPGTGGRPDSARVLTADRIGTLDSNLQGTVVCRAGLEGLAAGNSGLGGTPLGPGGSIGTTGALPFSVTSVPYFPYAPFSATAFLRGQAPRPTSVAAVDSAHAAALENAKIAAAAAEERVRVATLAWEHEHTTADALAR